MPTDEDIKVANSLKITLKDLNTEAVRKAAYEGTIKGLE